MPVRPAMVISWMLWEKSWAWRMAVSRLAWLDQKIMPAQTITSTSQMAAVRRTHIFQLPKLGIKSPLSLNALCLQSFYSESDCQIDLLDCASLVIFLQKNSGRPHL